MIPKRFPKICHISCMKNNIKNIDVVSATYSATVKLLMSYAVNLSIKCLRPKTFGIRIK